MSELIELNNISKKLREKQLLIWLGIPSQVELSRLGHKVVDTGQYGKEKNRVKLAFTLPIRENLDEYTRGQKSHLVNEACAVIERMRNNNGILKSYQVKRDVITYSILRGVSWDAYTEAIDHIEGRYFKWITAMVFSAFTLEAFLNHIGRMYFATWNSKEENFTPDKKLKIITKKLDLTISFGERPFQTFGDIFRFRNNMAHGKSEYLSGEGVTKLRISEDPPMPITEWESRVTDEKVEIFIKDTDKIIEVLYKATGLRGHHFDLGSSSWMSKSAK